MKRLLACALTVCLLMLVPGIPWTAAAGVTETRLPAPYELARSWPALSDGLIFSNPEGLAYAPNGSLYVADTEHDRVVQLSATGVVIRTFGAYGEAEGQFDMPRAVAVGNDGSVYVADTRNQRIQKFSAGGVFLAKWGDDRGSGEIPLPTLVEPNDVAVDSTTVYVADTAGNAVYRYTLGGQFVGKLEDPAASRHGRIQRPVQVAVHQGVVWVNCLVDNPDYTGLPSKPGDIVEEKYEWRIQKWSASGKYRYSFVDVKVDGPRTLDLRLPGTDRLHGEYYPGIPGDLQPDFHFAVDASGRLYLIGWNHSAGTTAGTLTRIREVPIGDRDFPVVEGSRVCTFNDARAPLTNAHFAFAVDGSFWALDEQGGRVLRFSATGSLAAAWGAQGDPWLSKPRDVAVAADGTMFVLEASRIRKFDPTGAFRLSFGAGTLTNARRMALGPDGNLYVLMQGSGNQRYAMFSPTGTLVSQTLIKAPGAIPNAIAVGPGNVVFVGDGNAWCVLRYEAGQFTGRIGEGALDARQPGEAVLANEPWGMAVTPDGTLYVVKDGQAMLFDGRTGASRGKPIRLFEDLPNQHGFGPRDAPLVVDASGSITSLGRLTGEGAVSGGMSRNLLSTWVPRQYSEGYDKVTPYKLLYSWAPEIGGVSSAPNPEGIALGPDGSVYVADTDHNRVLRYKPCVRLSALSGPTTTPKPYPVVTKGKSFEVSGSIAPTRTVGTAPVKIEAQQWSSLNKRWYTYARSFSATITSTDLSQSAFKAKVTFPLGASGSVTWRIRAVYRGRSIGGRTLTSYYGPWLLLTATSPVPIVIKPIIKPPVVIIRQLP
jgi:tripartite motif-containing protein 71